MIILAVKENNVVYAYNEKRELCLQENGELHGYTNSNVAIKRNNCIYIYNEFGSLIAEFPKDFVDTHNIVGLSL